MKNNSRRIKKLIEELEDYEVQMQIPTGLEEVYRVVHEVHGMFDAWMDAAIVQNFLNAIELLDKIEESNFVYLYLNPLLSTLTFYEKIKVLSGFPSFPAKLVILLTKTNKARNEFAHFNRLQRYNLSTKDGIKYIEQLLRLFLNTRIIFNDYFVELVNKEEIMKHKGIN